MMKASTATLHASSTPNCSTIINSAVNIEMEFVIDTLPIEFIGMNSSMMCNYNKFCADRLVIALGYQRH